MSVTPLTEDSIFAGRYHIVRCIAQGGMGAVYEAVHLETQRRCALKVMLQELTQTEGMQERFRQEARVAAQVESAFIVDIFDAGIDEETEMPFLVMELLKGEPLRKRLKRVGRFEPQDVVTYLHQAALALDKLHAASIVHRDLKPENLFLTEREDGSTRLKLLDFGVAKLVEEGATSAPATRSVGTPLYMAPEQFSRDPKVYPATDIYALGMMAYTLLVGNTYWLEESRAASVFAFAARAMDGPPDPASVRAQSRGVTLPPEFDAWFVKATAVSPMDRFSSASEAVLALAASLGLPTAPHRLSELPPLSLRPRPPAEPEIPPESGPRFSGAGVTAVGVTTTSRTKGRATRITIALSVSLATAVAAVGVSWLHRLWTGRTSVLTLPTTAAQATGSPAGAGFPERESAAIDDPPTAAPALPSSGGGPAAAAAPSTTPANPQSTTAAAAPDRPNAAPPGRWRFPPTGARTSAPPGGASKAGNTPSGTPIYGQD